MDHERVVLFPSEVKRVVPDMPWDKCIQVADNYNRTPVKKNYLTLSPKVDTMVQKSLYERGTEGLLNIGAGSLGLILAMASVQDGVPLPFSLAACIAGFMGAAAATDRFIFGNKLLPTPNRNIPIEPTPARGAISRHALMVLNFDLAEQYFGLSRSELYDRIEFLRDAKTTRERIIAANKKLMNPENIEEGKKILADHDAKFVEYCEWLEGCAHQVQEYRAEEEAMVRALEKQKAEQEALKVLNGIKHSTTSQKNVNIIN